MVISFMCKTEDKYHLLVVATEYLRGRAEARPQKQGISDKEVDFVY
jgi:hypothetical protein